MLRETEVENAPEAAGRDDDEALYCIACGALVTRSRWRFAMNGDHEHVVFNPAGLVFRVLCFREAPGAAAMGPATGEFTWFRGFRWRVASCVGCGVQLGWRYEGKPFPRLFFGLDQARLSTKPPPT